MIVLQILYSSHKHLTLGLIFNFPQKPVCYQDCAPAPGFVYLHHIEMTPIYAKPTAGRKSVVFQIYNEKRNFAIVSGLPLNNVWFHSLQNVDDY